MCRIRQLIPVSRQFPFSSIFVFRPPDVKRFESQQLCCIRRSLSVTLSSMISTLFSMLWVEYNLIIFHGFQYYGFNSISTHLSMLFLKYYFRRLDRYHFRQYIQYFGFNAMFSMLVPMLFRYNFISPIHIHLL